MPVWRNGRRTGLKILPGKWTHLELSVKQWPSRWKILISVTRLDHFGPVFHDVGYKKGYKGTQVDSRDKKSCASAQAQNQDTKGYKALIPDYLAPRTGITSIYLYTTSSRINFRR